MSSNLIIASVVAVVLVGSHFTAYRGGKAVVKADWQKEKISQLAQLSEFNAESRRLEQRRQSMVTEAQNAAKLREIVSTALAKRLSATVSSLRDDLARSRTNLPTATIASLRGRVEALSTVFEQCSRAHEELAGTAQGLASDLQLTREAWPK